MPDSLRGLTRIWTSLHRAIKAIADAAGTFLVDAFYYLALFLRSARRRVARTAAASSSRPASRRRYAKLRALRGTGRLLCVDLLPHCASHQ